MSLEEIGLAVSAIGSISGILLIIFGGFFYLIENKNRMRIAQALRSLGIGILILIVTFPFAILHRLIAEASSVETSISGIIIMSVFLGTPLIAMGVALYIGLNEKVEQILNPTTAQEKLRYYTPMPKK